MKRVILSAFALVFMAGVAAAQTSGSHSSRSTSVSSTTAKKTKKETKAPSEVLNNRKIYNWESGQRATPTGHEATPTNGGGYASLRKETPANKPKNQQPN